MPPLNIRKTTKADLEALRTLIVATWHATYDATMGPDRVTAITEDWHSLDRLGREIDHDDCHSLIAESSDGLIGHALVIGPKSPQSTLARLYVSPKAQRGGVGSALLAAAINSLTEFSNLELEVEEANEKARRFYAKHGFEQVERKSNCGDQDGIPTLVLRKTLNA